MLFAEVTNFSPPSEIAVWLACAGFAIWIFLLVDKLVLRLRGKSQEPPNGELKQSIKMLASRMKVLEDWRTDLTRKLEADKNEILIAGEHRAEKLHERINIILAAVSELKGEMKGRIND